MKRYAALIKETWWLWLVMISAGCIAGVAISFVFFVMLPICFIAFIYFGLMRYDEHGRPKGDGID